MERAFYTCIAIFGLAPFVIIGVMVYQTEYREIGPIQTYYVQCESGSATVRAEYMSRNDRSGSPEFYQVNGVRRASQSFPPDCFVTVSR